MMNVIHHTHNESYNESENETTVKIIGKSIIADVEHSNYNSKGNKVRTSEEIATLLKRLPNELLYQVCYTLPRAWVPKVVMADKYFCKVWVTKHVKVEHKDLPPYKGGQRRSITFTEDGEVVKTIFYINNRLDCVNIYSDRGKHRRYEKYDFTTSGDVKKVRLVELINYIKLANDEPNLSSTKNSDLGKMRHPDGSRNNYHTNYVMHGRYKKYHTNSRPEVVCYYCRGNLDGHYRAWYRDGKISEEAYYHDGTLHGRYYKSHKPSGSKYLRCSYNSGSLISHYRCIDRSQDLTCCYNRHGQFVGEYVDRIHHEYRLYSKHGDIIHQLTFVEGDLDVKWSTYSSHRERDMYDYAADEIYGTNGSYDGEDEDEDGYNIPIKITLTEYIEDNEFTITVKGYYLGPYNKGCDHKLYGTVIISHNGQVVTDEHGNAERGDYNELTGPMTTDFCQKRDRALKLLTRLRAELA